MAYTLTQAGDVMNIAEREYGTAAEIQFTKFTSCIGVVAQVGNNDEVIGIHLSLLDGQGEKFTEATVGVVTNVLTSAGYNEDNVIVLGQIAVWKGSAATAYAALIAALNPKDTFPLDDGTYGATIENGKIQLTIP